MTTFPGSLTIVTGATGGIGQALVDRIAGCGGDLLLCGRRETELHALAERFPKRVLGRVVGDLSEPLARRQLHGLMDDYTDRPLVLVNSAGSNRFAAFSSLDEATVRGLIETNLLLPILLTRSLLPLLEQAPSAQIINVGSAFGAIGFPGFATYSAAKFGLRGWSEALHRELADSTVTIQHIAPRATRTGFNPDTVDRMNRALGNTVDDPIWVADRICRAIERGTAERFLGWPERFLVRLNGLFPALVGRALCRKLPVLKTYFETH